MGTMAGTAARIRTHDERRRTMARIGTPLDTKDPFPEIEMNTLAGETIRLPEYFGDGFGVVQFIRGHW
jgi:hypothetical protein